MMNKKEENYMINKELSETLTELNEVFNNTSIDVIKRIPKTFLQFVAENVSDTYEFKYDKTKSLKEQNLKPKTKGLIALVYRDFICNNEEKQIYNEKVSNVLKEIELEKREKYNPDNLFKNENKIKEDSGVLNEVNLVEVKDNFLYKLIKKVKSILFTKK